MEWALVIEMRVRVKVESKSEVLEEGADRPCVLTKLLHNPQPLDFSTSTSTSPHLHPLPRRVSDSSIAFEVSIASHLLFGLSQGCSFQSPEGGRGR